MNPYKKMLARYPLTDRVTFAFDLPSAMAIAVFSGLSVTFVSIIGRKLGMDAVSLTLLSMSSFIGMFSNIWIGHLADRGDRRAWVFWPAIIARILMGGALVWLSPGYFLVIVCLFNIISSFPAPAYMSIMRSNYSHRFRGELMSYIRIAIQIVTAVAAFFAGWFMQAVPDGQRILFPLAAGFGMLSSILFYRIKPRRIDPERAATLHADSGFGDSLKVLFKDRLFIVYMAIYFLLGLPDKIVGGLEPIRFVDELGMSYTEAGLIQGSIPLLGALLGYFLSAKLSHRVSPFGLLVAAGILSSTRFLNTAIAGSAMDLVPGAFLNGVSNAGWDLLPLFTIILFVGEERVSLYFGMHATLVGVRGIIGPIFGTWLHTGAGVPIATVYWIAFWAILAAIVLMSAFWYYMHRHGGDSLARRKLGAKEETRS